MFNIFQFLEQWKLNKKQKKRLSKPARSLARFKKEYPNYQIGKNCYGVPIIKHQHPNAKVTIGSYCSFAKNVRLFLGGNHRTDWVTTYPFPAFFSNAHHIKDFEITNGDINIGNDVWLCEDTTVLSGVSIGNGAVIASGSIVTKDVAPYSIVGGNPAKHIRWRFDDQIRELLLASSWWDWPEEEILQISNLLCSNDIANFLHYASKRKP